jgi:hypothetical protein
MVSRGSAPIDGRSGDATGIALTNTVGVVPVETGLEVVADGFGRATQEHHHGDGSHFDEGDGMPPTVSA